MTRRLTNLGWLLIAAGFAAIGGGWAGVQSTPVVAVQMSYLVSGALLGIAMVGLGAAALRWDDQRASRILLEELVDRFDDIERELIELKAATAPAGHSPQRSRTTRARHARADSANLAS